MRYRWAVLAAGTTAQTSFSALAIGLPVLVPTLREEYGLSLGQIGVLLGAEWVGALLTMLPWGIAADRFGERVVLGLGLGACAVFLAGAAYAPDFRTLILAARARGRGGRERELGQRPRGHALVRCRRARARARASGRRRSRSVGSSPRWSSRS